jgi:hypothetical protein
MASPKALEQRDITIPDPRVIQHGPHGRVARVDLTEDDGERITFENLNRASFRRLQRDPLVLEVVPLRLDPHVKASKRTIKRRDAR